MRTHRWRSVAAASIAALSLSGCQSWASMIDLEAYEEDGEVFFRDPGAFWFTKHCVRHIEVSAYRKTSETSWEQRGVVWSAGSRSGGCLTGLPFRYGEKFSDSDPEDFTPPVPLEPETSYEIFIERRGTAGQGSFMIEADGTIVNQWS